MIPQVWHSGISVCRQGPAPSSRENGAQCRARALLRFETEALSHYVEGEIGSDCSLTVIIILALIALFIGLRLYSVLGERTGHEQQQPILKPAEPEARLEPRTAAASFAPAPNADPADTAY